VRVQWRELNAGGRLVRLTESYDDTRKGIAEAKAFAKGKHEALLDQPKAGSPVPSTAELLTLRQLRERYFAAHENEWEAATVRNKTSHWKVLELLLGRGTLAGEITPERLDEVVNDLLASTVKRAHKKRSANQVRMAIATLTAAYRWAVVDRGILAPTRITNYSPKLKKAMKTQVVKMAEYTADERGRLSAVLDPRNPREWRPWALNTLFAYCAPRERAARHLEVSDIELAPVEWKLWPTSEKNGEPVFAGRIHWRADTDKMDNERWQPMPAPVAEAFWIALAWRAHDGYTGRFVFYGVQRRTRGQALRREPHRAKHKESLEGIEVEEKPYTYGALNGAMLRAEKLAGIEHVPYRSTHGHRRGVSGDIHQQTGSSKKAADWIGDKSTKVVEKHYLLARDENLQESAELVTATVTAAKKPTRRIKGESE
jgi:hypothetical protein